MVLLFIVKRLVFVIGSELCYRLGFCLFMVIFVVFLVGDVIMILLMVLFKVCCLMINFGLCSVILSVFFLRFGFCMS